GFDHIFFGNEPQAYPIAQGSHFKEELLRFFPQEEKALIAYEQALQAVSKAFPLFSLKEGDESGKKTWFLKEVEETLKDLIPHSRLRNVLFGNSLLYAGERGRTPFYTHALVNRSFMDSAYKCEGRSSRIAKALWRQLSEHGGTIFNREQVSRLTAAKGRIQALHTSGGMELRAGIFIVNVHPAKALEWLDVQPLKRSMQQRLAMLKNSISACMVNL